MRVLLTSAGLETEGITTFFKELVNKDFAEVKALFIPIAAVNPDAIEVLPKCMEDLLKCGISAKNITVYDLHDCMTEEELKEYDVVYLCGGKTEYLLERIRDTGFDKVLADYIEGNGIVLGVSAGSIIFANNLPDNLGLIDTKLDVHCAEGDDPGRITLPVKKNIRLTNERAIMMYDVDEMEII